MGDTVELFGARMHAWTMEQTVSEIDRRLGEGVFTQQASVNVAKLVRMQEDDELAKAVKGCDIINIDGAGIVFACRILGMSVPQRVAGIDLFFRLLAYAESAGKSVYLLGATPDTLERAVAELRKSYPALTIAGRHHGYFWDDQEGMVDAIRASGADLLFVGISSPLKERFIDRWKDRLGVAFAMGVGGTFDVVSGDVKRAPRWMQRLGMEWLFRMLQEPRRMLRRYLVTNAVFTAMLVKERFRRWRAA